MPPDAQTDPILVVSNHAALRYLERVRGVDLGHGFSKLSREEERLLLWKICGDLKTTPPKVKEIILTPDVAAAMVAGATKFVSPGFVIVFRDGTVSTVLEPQMRKKRLPKKARRG